MVTGIEHFRSLETNDDLELDGETVRLAMEADIAQGLVPFFITATLGTTSTTAFDRVSEIGPVAESFGAWLHIDSAFAGASFVCPEIRSRFTTGIEHAHSLDFNPHKWLLTNFDCSALWTNDQQALITALSITPEVIRNKASESGKVVDYKDWQVPLGRRFRALKLWFVLRTYGVQGLQGYIRHHIRLAELLESLILADERFEISCKRTSSLVCFRIRDSTDDENKLLLDRLNESGKLFLSHTIHHHKKQYILRVAINGYYTQEEHIRSSWEFIQETAAAILANRNDEKSS